MIGVKQLASAVARVSESVAHVEDTEQLPAWFEQNKLDFEEVLRIATVTGRTIIVSLPDATTAALTSIIRKPGIADSIGNALKAQYIEGFQLGWTAAVMHYGLDRNESEVAS